MVLCVIFTSAGVSAAEDNITDTQAVNLESADAMSVVSSSNEVLNTTSVSDDSSERAGVLLGSSSNEVLSDSGVGGSSDFVDILKLSSESMVLIQDYNFDSTVTIGKSIVIDGNGHTITGDTTLFSITGNNVVLKNLIIENTQTSDDMFVWSGMNGQLNNVEFKNVTSSGNILLWEGDSGIVNNIKFENVSSSNITVFNGDNIQLKNITIENNIVETTISFNGLNTYIDGLYKSNNDYKLTIIFNNNNGTLTNSHFNNTYVQYYGTAINIVNSSFNNNSEAKLFSSNVPGSEIKVSGCNFTYGRTLFEDTRNIIVMDNIRVINFTVTNSNRNSLFACKCYYTLKNSYFENITGGGLLAGGFKVYNTTFNNISTMNFMNLEAGLGWYSCVLLNNSSIINSKLTNTLTGQRNDYTINLNIIDCNFENNTFTNTNTFSSNEFFVNGTVFKNNIIGSTNNAFFKITGNKLYFANNQFINNTGFKTATVIISGTNYYDNNTFEDNTNSTGSIVGLYNSTLLNSFNYTSVFYVDNCSNGSGLNSSDRCNLTYALNNIIYGGTLYLANGLYNTLTTQKTIYCNILGEGDNVIINKGSFNMKLNDGKIEHIIFNNSVSAINFGTTNIMIKDCTFENITNNFILDFDDGYSYSVGHEIINITVNNSNFKTLFGRSSGEVNNFGAGSYVINGITVKDSTMDYLLALPVTNGHDIKNINCINSIVNNTIIYIYRNITLNITNPNNLLLDFYRSYGYKEGAVDKIDGLTITDCTYSNIFTCTDYMSHSYYLTNVYVENSIISDNSSSLFNGYNLNVDTLELNNLSERVNIFNFTNGTGSLNDVSLNNVNISSLIYGNPSSKLSNINLSNCDIGVFIDSGVNFTSYSNLNFTNVTLGDSDIIFTLDGNDKLSGCVFDNVSGHLTVIGNYATISDVVFKNMNNSLLNGSCIWVNASFVSIDSVSFINNTGLNGAVYITNSSVRPGITNTVFQGNIAVNAGGAIYIQYSTEEFYITIDDSTSDTINESKEDNSRFNGLYGTFYPLVTEVYVTNDTSRYDKSNGKTWSTPTSFILAYGMAGKNCVFYFISGDVFNFTGEEDNAVNFRNFF